MYELYELDRLATTAPINREYKVYLSIQVIYCHWLGHMTAFIKHCWLKQYILKAQIYCD